MPIYGNSYYPATYQAPTQPQTYPYPQYSQAGQSMQMPMQMSGQAQMPNNSSIIWVQGEVGAKAYPVAAGASVILMDSEENRFFIKSTDASGMPLPLRVFTYTEEVATQRSYDSGHDTGDYVTRKELEEMLRNLRNTDTEVIVPQKSGRRERANVE